MYILISMHSIIEPLNALRNCFATKRTLVSSSVGRNTQLFDSKRQVSLKIAFHLPVGLLIDVATQDWATIADI